MCGIIAYDGNDTDFSYQYWSFVVEPKAPTSPLQVPVILNLLMIYAIGPRLCFVPQTMA